jgi:RNA processing factor Prp31
MIRNKSQAEIRRYKDLVDSLKSKKDFSNEDMRKFFSVISDLISEIEQLSAENQKNQKQLDGIEKIEKKISNFDNRLYHLEMKVGRFDRAK